MTAWVTPRLMVTNSKFGATVTSKMLSVAEMIFQEGIIKSSLKQKRNEVILGLSMQSKASRKQTFVVQCQRNEVFGCPVHQALMWTVGN